MIHFDILKCNDILKFNVIDKKMKNKITSTINFIVKLHNYITYLQCTKFEIYVCLCFSHWQCLSPRDVVVRWLKPWIVKKK